MVTPREVLTESFLKDIVDSLAVPQNASAAELARIWKDEAKQRLGHISITLSHRVDPILKLLLEQRLAKTLSDTFIQIDTIEEGVHELVERYKRCFNQWVDAPDHVSFRATNKRLLGSVDVKDVFILTFFAFCTCKRSKNDNLLQLGVVGCSTSGKSTLFESCLMEGSHVTTNEQGVGRFQVGNKPVLMFHDISINTLALSKDTEKIKTIARTEPTISKVHSTVINLPPLFLFYSSNERLMSHRFANSHKLMQPSSYPTQINTKRCSPENLLALQNRFIEAFVRSPPPINVNDLPKSGGFQRIHGILGMYDRILNILEQYCLADIHSPMLVQYVLHGLANNLVQYNDINKVDIGPRVKAVVVKYMPNSPLLQHL